MSIHTGSSANQVMNSRSCTNITPAFAQDLMLMPTASGRGLSGPRSQDRVAEWITYSPISCGNDGRERTNDADENRVRRSSYSPTVHR